MTPQGSHAGVNLHSSEGTATIVLSGEPTEEVGVTCSDTDLRRPLQGGLEARLN